MPSFADIKAKAVKAKDVTVSKAQNVKDRNTSVPLKKTNWDPYSKQPPPPPPAPRIAANTRPTPSFPPPPTAHNRPSHPASTSSQPPPPTRSPALPSPSPAPPLPTRSPNPPPNLPNRSPKPPPTPPTRSLGPPPIVRSTRPGLASPKVGPIEARTVPEIDWANLSAEDKEVFFSWLDEFFAKFFNITIEPR